MTINNEFLDRRNKLLPCQKEMIMWWYVFKDERIVDLSKRFNVSQRTIRFILFPDELKKNRQQNKLTNEPNKKQKEIARKHYLYKKNVK